MNQSPSPPQPNTPFRVRPPDPIDKITGKHGQLHALPTSLHADGLDNFLGLSPELQNNLLWLAAELTQNIRGTVTQLPYPTPCRSA
ncbi:hypothetical protein [Pusillimonas sp. T2]|uniref:hypothetical protein n=1 Tax=Pusillimonas sp. T2 TaxID=1548123 RepID=UPI00117B906E|nr:hypothetical protein [Pusillimonas sp. T2]